MITLKGINIKNLIKSSLWIGLYLVGLLAVIFSIASFPEKDLNAALLFFSASIIIYTFLIIKDLKFLSLFSFITMIPISLVILGTAGNQVNGNFSNAFDEKAFLLSFALVLSFFIVNCVFWIKTRRDWKKLMSLFFIALILLILFVFGTGSPNYHQNFVYTRIFISIFFIFSIFLIMERKKSLRVFGILGIFLSIGLLLMSAVMFAAKTYVIEGDEWDSVYTFINPKAEEMLGCYNQNDFDNFCNHCSVQLKNSFEIDSSAMKNWRSMYGQYLNLEKPEIIRARGFYYIEYPVKFQNVEDIFYLTFMLSDVSPESTIYGFNLSSERGE